MACENTTGYKEMIANGTVTAYAAVKLSSATQVAVTSATTDVIYGIAQQTVATTKPVTVKLLTAPGTFKITAAATLSAGSFAYLQATAGKFSTSTSNKAAHTFLVIEASTADGDIIEAVPTFGQS